ncbi:probable 2-oxoglutarate-dependent dioxygenase AOP1 isoform X2 [Salvia miltiorrhiza]|uniref:probable 2-oxoglutarate-dependent dioxygenase AOP1 isoform X2 n=1 Tax=Salvia miltiorrhiza TaxID=226208 RepID=UPI0025ABC5C3|nr:probable 2-oxoglutarate-dependent dioxygenase AOP1 isoform X2 [Salvia miltiorrhiza]
MGSVTMKLPIIDFSNLKNQRETWESTKAQVRQALEEYGCFEATFDHIPPHLLKSVIHETKQLFDLPLPIKLRNRSNKPYHGYVGQYSMVPLYESLGIADALSPGEIEAFAALMWAQGNPSFSKSVESFSEKLSELDKIVRKMVVESLGLEKYMDEHMDSTNYLIRLQKYDRPRSHETELGLSSHTDKNIVTILYQNEINGLEVLTKDGHWFTSQPSPNSFVVMIGESFSAWTNGRLHAPYHKVMMSGDEARYSIGLFSVPKPGYMIKAPEEMVDEEHPLLFNPYDHHRFLQFYYTEAGQKSPAALKEYCGH